MLDKIIQEAKTTNNIAFDRWVFKWPKQSVMLPFARPDKALVYFASQRWEFQRWELLPPAGQVILTTPVLKGQYTDTKNGTIHTLEFKLSYHSPSNILHVLVQHNLPSDVEIIPILNDLAKQYQVNLQTLFHDLSKKDVSWGVLIEDAWNNSEHKELLAPIPAAGIGKLLEENLSLEIKFESFLSGYQELFDEYCSLKTEKEEVQEKYVDVLAQHVSLSRRSIRAQQQIKNMMCELGNLKDDIKLKKIGFLAIEKENTSLIDQLWALKTQLQETEKTHKENQKENARLINQLQETEKKHQENQQEYSSLLEKQRDLVNKNTLLEQKKAELEKENTRLMNQLQETEKTHKENQKEYSSLLEKQRDLVDKNTFLEQKKAELETENARLINQLQETKKTHQDNLSKLEQHYKGICNEADIKHNDFLIQIFAQNHELTELQQKEAELETENARLSNQSKKFIRNDTLKSFADPTKEVTDKTIQDARLTINEVLKILRILGTYGCINHNESTELLVAKKLRAVAIITNSINRFSCEDMLKFKELTEAKKQEDNQYSPYLFIRRERHWFRKTYGNTKTWATIMDLVKKKLEQSILSKEDLSEDAQNEATIIFKTHRYHGYGFGIFSTPQLPQPVSQRFISFKPARGANP